MQKSPHKIVDEFLPLIKKNKLNILKIIIKLHLKFKKLYFLLDLLMGDTNQGYLTLDKTDYFQELKSSNEDTSQNPSNDKKGHKSLVIFGCISAV